MNLRDLEYVVAIAETGHFGLAAERCHTSQPTLSMQLKKLEGELGAALFERTPRGALTTAVGAAIVVRARNILEDVRQLRAIAARGGAGGFGGVLRLGVIPTAGPYLLPRILPAVQDAYPRLELHLREAMTARLLTLLQENELDAAIVSEPIDDQSLARAPLLQERFMLALQPDHALAHGRLAKRALAGEAVLMLEEGHCLREQTTLVCRALGLRPLPQIQASSVETMRQMVALGLGLAVLPELATIGPFATSGLAVRPLDGDAAGRLLTLVWRKTYPRPEQLDALAALIRRCLEPVLAGATAATE